MNTPNSLSKKSGAKHPVLVTSSKPCPTKRGNRVSATAILPPVRKTQMELQQWYSGPPVGLGNGGDYRLCGSGTSGCVTASPYAAGQKFACQNNTDCGANLTQLKQNISGVAVFPSNTSSISSLSATSMACNGTNTLTINGSNLALQGTELLVKGVVVHNRS
jgi:hypothetical protein